jgi:flagellar biogenesis protein FliO
MKIPAYAFVFLFPSIACAQDGNSFTGELLRTAVVLLIVLGMLVASVLLVRRFKSFPVAAGGGKVLQVVGLGANERAVVFALHDQRFLLGVTAHQVTLLSQWQEPNAESTLNKLP